MSQSDQDQNRRAQDEHEDAQVNYGDFWMPGGHLFSAFRSQKHTLGAKE